MDIFVSLSGNDNNYGDKASPFKSIERAKEKVREIIAMGLTEPITVRVAEGNYRVSPMTFGALDSGSEKHTIKYVAEGAVTLNGGVTLAEEMFHPVEDEIKACLAPDAREKVVYVDLGKLGISCGELGKMCAIGSHNSARLYDGAVLSPMWCELFINNVRQTIARYPNEGQYLKFCGAISEGEGWESSTHESIPHDTWIKMRNPRADIYRIDADTAKRAAGWKHKDDLWMFGYPRHDWADMSTPIVKIDANECSMESKYVSMFGIHLEEKKDDYHNGGKYYFYNVLDELDAPGEWYLDRERAVLYLYPAVELSETEIILSLAAEPIIKFDGAEHLSFFGFSIMGTRADGISGSCSDVKLDSLLVKNVAGHGIVLTGYRNVVCGCEILETGRGGIYIDGGDRATLTHGENVAENNYVHDFSKIYKTYQSGIHLLGCGNIARNNEICKTPHQALGYQGNEHLIEYNYIHDCTYESSDAGAVYSGFDWAAHGTVIRYNLIENIGGDGYSPDGIYWDDGLSGQTAYGNIIVAVKKFSLQLGGGRDNVFCHNLIINSGDAALKFDDRYRESFFTKGHFYSIIEHSGASRTHWVKVEQLPYRSELWAKKYPNLAKLKTDPSTDPDDPDYGINPSYCEVRNNAVVAPRGKLYRVFDGAYKYSVIENNYVYDSFSSAGIDEKTYSLSNDSAIFKDIQGFPKIPTERIGRYK